MKSGVVISQQDNYAGNFGLVNRASAIFYYTYNETLTTTLSFMDYWSVKRELDVLVVASVRDMHGTLVLREQLTFDQGNVVNYAPKINQCDTFEGSIELEVFATSNMVIPYSAMMAVYQTAKTVTMVHSYARVYSKYEVEENRTITHGRESCWTIRDNADIRSFCVMHNGYATMPAQEVVLTVQNHVGETMQKSIQLDALKPFETVKCYPADHIDHLATFLEGKPGNASINFELANSFTRLLVGNQTTNGDELQVTHSNFNYTLHSTDCLTDAGEAVMNIVELPFNNPQVIVYPDRHDEEYIITHNGSQLPSVTNSERVEIDVNAGSVVSFGTKSGKLPSRIVTGFSGQAHQDGFKVDFECSLGVRHPKTPLKRSHWGVVAAGEVCKTRVIIQPHKEIFGDVPPDVEVSVALFSAHSKQVEKISLTYEQVLNAHKGLFVGELFDAADTLLNNDLGYIYLTSSYGGFTCYTTLENNQGSVCMEHTF